MVSIDSNKIEKLIPHLAFLGDGRGHILAAYNLGEAAYRYQRQIETNDRIRVGMNAYQSENELPIPVFKPNPEMERRQVEKVKAVRARRDTAAVARHLSALAAAAGSKENLMPVLVECIKAYATLGEICTTLRGVWGVYQPSQVI